MKNKLYGLMLYLFLSHAHAITQELADRTNKNLAICGASFHFAAQGQDMERKNILEKMSNLSLQAANLVTKTPYEKLRQARDYEFGILTDEFIQVTKSKDNERILAWGRLIGQRNNLCNEFINKIFEDYKKQ